MREMTSANPKRSPSKLMLTSANGAAVTFPLLGAEILIGRLDSVDLILDDPAVSRVHAKIVKDQGADVLVDLESSTGTAVNGEVIKRHILRDGDVIEIANSRLEYRE